MSLNKVVVVLALLLASPAFAAAARKAPAPPPSPERTVTGFYAAYVRLHPSGIPGPRVKRGLERFLSQRLNALLTDADRAEAQYAIATKNEVPPLVEGDIFSSLFEGATSSSMGQCLVMEESMTATCTVSLTNTMDGQQDTTWTDTVLMVREGRTWKIDDVRYGGTWPFANKGRMTETLNDAIAESKKAQN